MTLDAMTFIHRFLQHVLPKGFQKVRYFAFLHPSAKKTFTALQEQFSSTQPDMDPAPTPEPESESEPAPTVTKTPICCPHCGGPLAYIGRRPPHKDTRGPP